MGVVSRKWVWVEFTGVVVRRYRISSIKRPGVNFFRWPIYPAFIGDWR